MSETAADHLAWLIKVGQITETKEATKPTPTPTESEEK